MTKWLIVADQRTARLVSLQSVPGGRWHARQHLSLESQWEDYHEHRRPSALGGRSSSTHEHASPGFSETERQEERRRFARDIAKWIDGSCGSLVGNEDLPVLAAPGMVPALRQALDTHPRVKVLRGELAHLRPDELAEHPAVIKAVEARSRAETQAAGGRNTRRAMPGALTSQKLRSSCASQTSSPVERAAPPRALDCPEEAADTDCRKG